MRVAAATFESVSAYSGRAVSSRKPRQFGRTIGSHVAMGVIASGAVILLGTVATVAAIWLTSTSVVTRLEAPRISFSGPGTLALASADPRLAMAANDDAADKTFQSRWANATAGTVPRALIIADVPAKAAAPFVVAKLEPVTAPTPLPPSKRAIEAVSAVPLPLSRPTIPDIARAPVVGPPRQLAMIMPTLPTPVEKRVAPQETKKPEPELDSKTAVYDISARTVFLPRGEKLEAHSGLYDKMDDPRYVKVRMHGPTPPNVYDLTLREEIFHGVRAIRLNPVDEAKMFGRAGILAHTYMLGPNGQSNGCVSFKNYDKFLQAFLRGEVDRLIVVPDGGMQLALANRSRRERPGRYASYEPVATTEHSSRAW